VTFDFSQAYVVFENQRAMGFIPQKLRLDSLELFQGEVIPSSPVQYRQHLGSAVADLMLGADPMLLIISDKMVQTFQEIRATGWTTYPVVCRTRGGEVVSSRWGLSVIGRCGPPLWKRSGRFQRRLAPGAPPAPYLRGLYFDDGSWDGTDIFSPAGTGFVIVVERVYRALRAAKVRNFKFKRLSEFEMLDHERMAAEGDSPPWLN
jgi:hypothetical protein